MIHLVKQSPVIVVGEAVMKTFLSHMMEVKVTTLINKYKYNMKNGISMLY